MGEGFCDRDYRPNHNNYNGGTDCGLGDGVFEDWRSRGGSCPSGYREDRDCGTGCRSNRSNRCA